jgi:flagellar basal body-associated protein FliL
VIPTEQGLAPSMKEKGVRPVYIGLGTVVLILVVLAIVMMMRRSRV